MGSSRSGIAAATAVALTVAGKDLRERLRDRSLWLLGIVAPALLAVLVSLAFGSFERSEPVRLVIVDADGHGVGPAFSAVLRSPELRDSIVVSDASSRDEARARLDNGEVQAALVIPEGLADDVAAGRHPQLERLGAHGPVAVVVVDLVARTFAATVAGDQLAADTVRAVAPDRQPADGSSTAAPASPAPAAPTALIRDVRTGVGDASPASYFGPAMAVLFLFFTVSTGPRSILAERRMGTLRRMAAAPVSASGIVVGKVLSAFVTGLVGLVMVWVVSAAAFHTSWGDPLAVFVLLAVTTTAFLALTTLAISFARTESQADGIAAILAFAFALLGGVFLPLYDLPGALRLISALTPNGWTMVGFVDLVADDGGLTTILRPILVLLAISALTGAGSLWRYRRIQLL
jgi:ABC-2 type transport system permease protein